MERERGRTPVPAGRPRLAASPARGTLTLTGGWEVASLPRDAATAPDALASAACGWMPAVVPGTVASALRARGAFDWDSVPDFDALDWWYRTRFADDAGDAGPDAIRVLRLEGLATLADVWLNGTHVLRSEDMFATHEIDVTAIVRPENELLVRFESLRGALERRRPRPAWRTRLTEHQQLRWFRTTLLGRMPGWSPPVRAVGPWRPVTIETRAHVDVLAGDVAATLDADGPIARAALRLRPLGDTRISRATLEVAGDRAELELRQETDGAVSLTGALRPRRARPWWPHTHGDQPLYDATLRLATTRGEIRVALGRVGFRRVELDTADGAFTVRVNGVPVFCRGACWTSADPVAVDAPAGTVRRLTRLARDGGMNMLRVVGTMIYESDAFFDACDELGILVWQEFPFANMDYPAGDERFADTVRHEAAGAVARLRRHPSLAVWCGNSEVAQQAAMLGLPPEAWHNAVFDRLLPEAVADGGSDAPYWPGSPWGGALPFRVDAGDGHYFGVGAYLRPLDDARRAAVRFASETLGFANVPDQRTVDALLPNGEAPGHHPRWKARVPRDHGAGWDFDDVRDHYLGTLFGVDPARLRYADPERYLALGRVVTGEVMAATIAEWRRAGSPCAGALVWTFQDLWPGAGWGVIDALGRPKAAYHFLRRAFRPLALGFTDEGVNGLALHLSSDRADDVVVRLGLTLLRDGQTVVGSGVREVRVPARSACAVDVEEVLRAFHDASYAYRFGPPGHDVVFATLADAATGEAIGDAYHFPLGLSAERHELGLSAAAEWLDADRVRLVVRTQRFAHAVSVDAPGWSLDDDFFSVCPGVDRVVVASRQDAGRAFTASLLPLNAASGVQVSAGPPPATAGAAAVARCDVPAAEATR